MTPQTPPARPRRRQAKAVKAGSRSRASSPRRNCTVRHDSARHEFFHLSLVLRLAALPSFFDLGLTIDTRMGILSWYYARTVRTVYTFLLLGVPSAIVIATAA